MKEQLETQTLHPKKYLKWTNVRVRWSYAIPILINYKVIRHTLTY